MSKATAPIVLGVPGVEKLSNFMLLELLIIPVTNIVLLLVHSYLLFEQLYRRFASAQ